MNITPSHDHPLVEVAWWDAIDVLEWQDPSTFTNKPILSWSVGYLVADDDVAITVVGLINDNHWTHGITIPRGMVDEIRYLKLKRSVNP